MIDEINVNNSFSQNQQKSESKSLINTLSDSIFDRMDKNKDGQATKNEANDFGFTTLGDKPLSKTEFRELFGTFREKTSTLKGVLEDFGDVFSSLDLSDYNSEIQLTEKQRKELLSRIEMAKAYNITNNKKTVLDELTQDYNKLLQGKTISKGSLTDILRHAKFDTDSISDGKISTFNQGDIGDCYFLSLLNSYASTPDGEKNIKDRIKQNSDGSYTVTFNNPFNQKKKEEYIVTAKDLEKIRDKKNGARGAGGDIDVNILEVATNKMLEKYLPKGYIEDSFGYTKETKAIEGSDIIKQTLIHKSFGYSDSPKYIYTKDDGTIEECSYLFEIDDNGKIKMPNIDSIKRTALPCSSIIDLIQKRNYKMNELTIGKSGTEQSPMGHEYNLVKITDNGIVVNNPHYTQYMLSIPLTEREKLSFNSINYYPQNTIIPISECI